MKLCTICGKNKPYHANPDKQQNCSGFSGKVYFTGRESAHLKVMSLEQIDKDLEDITESQNVVIECYSNIGREIDQLNADSYHKGFEITSFEGVNRYSDNCIYYSLLFDGEEFNIPNRSEDEDRVFYEHAKEILSHLLDERYNGAKFRSMIEDVIKRYNIKQQYKGEVSELRDIQHEKANVMLQISTYKRKLEEELEKRAKLEKDKAWKILEKYASDHDISPVEALQQAGLT